MSAEPLKNLRSYVRVRPFIDKEAATPLENSVIGRPIMEPIRGPKTPASADLDTSVNNAAAADTSGHYDTIQILDPATKFKPKKNAQYRSRRVFWSMPKEEATDPDCSQQQDIYDEIGVSMVNSICSGFNSTCVVMGTAKSGKMHTMFGQLVDGESEKKDDRGLATRFICNIFDEIKRQRPAHSSTLMELEFVEVLDTGNNINDLLVGKRTAQQIRDAEAIKLRDDAAEGVRISNVKTVNVHEHTAALAAIKAGLAKTTRSKAKGVQLFLTIRFNETLTFEDPNDPSATVTKTSRCTANFVLLSGMPTAMQRCLEIASARDTDADSKPGRVPTRESAITRLITDYFGGNCQSYALTCVSPFFQVVKDSTPFLERASKIRGIKCNAKVLYDSSTSEFRRLNDEMKGLNSQVHKASEAQMMVQQELDRRQQLLDETSQRFEQQDSALMDAQEQNRLAAIVSQVMQARLMATSEKDKEAERVLSVEIEETTAKDEALKQEVESKETELAAANTAQAAAVADHETAVFEHEEMNAKITHFKQRYAEYETFSEELGDVHERLVQEHEEKMKNLTESHDTKSEELVKVEAEIEPLTHSHKIMKIAQSAVIAEAKQKKDAEDQKKKVDDEEKQLRADIAQLEKDIEQLEKDIKKADEDNACCIIQ